MDWLIQLVFLVIYLGSIWGFVKLIRRSSRDNKILRWLWILGLATSAFLFVQGVLAMMASGSDVFYACHLWDGTSTDDSYCYSPETRSQVARELWMQAMTPPSLRDPAICWAFYTALHCRDGYRDNGWDYYLFQMGLGLFFGLVLGFLTLQLTRDPRKEKEKAKSSDSAL
jgi:hypothetical protein